MAGCPKITGKGGAWSILKLIALGYVIPMYTTIISKHFDKMFYVDLFAGSGINVVNGKKTLGSPFIAINSASKPFDYCIFMEKNEKKADALRCRLKRKSKIKGYEWLQNNFKVIQGTANNNIDDVLNLLREKGMKKWSGHSFWFIDPYKNTVLSLKTMKKICTQTNSDLFINVLKSELWRIIKSVGLTGENDKLDNWIGKNNWHNITRRNDITKRYHKIIQDFPDLRGKKRTEKEIVNVTAKEKNQSDSYYDLLFATVKTKEENPWLEVVRNVRDYLKVADDEFVKDVFDILYMGQKGLDDYL